MRFKNFIILASIILLGGWHGVSTQPVNATVSTSSTPTLGQSWRDQEIVTLFTHGEMKLRVSGTSALYFNVGVAAPGVVRMGIISGGTKFDTYVQDTPSSCITNWPTTGAHTFTYGARGFTVYLLIDGIQAIDTCQTTTINPTGAINYAEYRPQGNNVGQPSVAVITGSATATFNYFPYTFLYSVGSTLDSRDFGMRVVAPVTGTISASSNTLNLSAAADFRVGDRVIIEVGGEVSAGYNTIGVGGVSPALHYANSTTRDADHTQANGTYAYLDTDGTAWVYNTGSSTWVAAGLGGNYYIGVKTALSLVARVTAVNATPATSLTLDIAASVSAASANVYLDSLPSFYPFTTCPSLVFANRSDGLPNYPNMTLSVPAGTWYFSNNAVVSNAGGSGGERVGFILVGQGTGSTTIKNPKGVPSQFLDVGFANTGVDISGFTYVGNLGDAGYGFATVGANKQFFGDYPIAMQGSATNGTFHSISCINDIRGCVSISGTNPQILNASATVNVGQRAYFQWQFQLSNCTGGQIANSTAAGTFLLKSFEFFACNGVSINNVTGTNALFSTNSSTSWEIRDFTDTITTNSFFNANSGAIDEAVVNVNNNAFGSGNTGAIKGNWSIVQQGYIDSSNNTLKFIQIATTQTNVTVTGGFPGGGGCSTTLPGFMSAPNYDAGSAEFGAMAIYSDAASTIVNGIRIKGTAIGTPGHSGHFGNISLGGASSQVNNSVADVIQTGPTLFGNQTNAAYGGC